jgi:hypothetical protein
LVNWQTSKKLSSKNEQEKSHNTKGTMQGNLSWLPLMREKSAPLALPLVPQLPDALLPQAGALPSLLPSQAWQLAPEGPDQLVGLVHLGVLLLLPAPRLPPPLLLLLRLLAQPLHLLHLPLTPPLNPLPLLPLPLLPPLPLHPPALLPAPLQPRLPQLVQGGLAGCGGPPAPLAAAPERWGTQRSPFQPAAAAAAG